MLLHSSSRPLTLISFNFYCLEHILFHQYKIRMLIFVLQKDGNLSSFVHFLVLGDISLIFKCWNHRDELCLCYGPAFLYCLSLTRIYFKFYYFGPKFLIDFAPSLSDFFSAKTKALSSLR